MKFGIYLAFAPGQDLINQGISRVTAMLIKGTLENAEHQLVLACPKWSLESLEELLDDHHIDASKLEFITTQNIPVWVRIKWYIDGYRKKRRYFFRRLARAILRVLDRIGGKVMDVFFWAMAAYNPFQFILRGFTFAVIATVLSPILLLALLPKLFAPQKGHKAPKHAQQEDEEDPYEEEDPTKPKKLPKKKPGLLPAIIRMILTPAKNLKRNVQIKKVYEKLRSFEMTQLIRRINKRQDIAAWYVPAMFWQEVKAIEAPIVMMVPDLVPIDFPSQYRSDWMMNSFDYCATSMSHADALLCYGPHVRQKHVIERFGIPEDQVFVVENATMDQMPYLTKAMEEYGVDTLDEASIRILQEFQEDELKNDPYLSDFNLADMKFFIYSSQDRPHKNIMNLLRAYESLLRSRKINAKLILTANIMGNKYIRHYIRTKRLHRDVLSFYDIPSKVLAALNQRAVASVIPTLFEGGFPIFSVSEAMSVGTPFIIGRTRTTLERFSPKNEKLAQHMLFNPYRWQDIAEKMLYAYEHRAQLFAEETPYYQELAQYDWRAAAKKHWGILQRVAEKKRAA